MVERLMASWWAWFRIAAAMSSRLQRVAVEPPWAGRLLAMATTSLRASGGKAPGPTGPRSVLQAGEPVFQIAAAPMRDGVATAAEFRGDLAVVGVLWLGGPQHDACSKGQSLWSGTGPNERFKLLAFRFG